MHGRLLRRSELGFTHAAVVLGNPCRQLFQVDVTFAFVSASADQFTLSIVMAKEEDKKVYVCPLPYNCSRLLYL